MSFWDGLISEAMLVSGILDLDAQSSLLPMIPTILSRQKGFLCHATRQTRSNWQRFIAWPESQNDLNRTTDMQAESLGESGESGSQTCKHVRYIVGICIYIYTRVRLGLFLLNSQSTTNFTTNWTTIPSSPSAGAARDSHKYWMK